MTKIILVRHCQAEGNLKRFFQGKIDSDITKEGYRQIAQTAELLSVEYIDAIYSSSLIRARKTADGINVYHELPINIDDRLAEIDAGDWEGKLLTDIEKEYPKQISNWRNNPSVFEAPNGESMAEVYERVNSALKDIITANKEKTVCIVSHGCAIMNMMCFAHGWGVENIKEISLGTNMSVNVMKFDDNFNCKILMENYVDHLQ